MSSDVSELRELLGTAIASYFEDTPAATLPDNAPDYLNEVASSSSAKEAVNTLANHMDEVYNDLGSFSVRSGDILLDVGGSSLGVYHIKGHERDDARGIDVYEVATLAESDGRQGTTGLTERHPDGTTVLLKDDSLIDLGMTTYREQDTIGSTHLPQEFVQKINKVITGLHRDDVSRDEYKAATRYHELGHADLVADLDATTANDFLRSYEDIGLSEAYATVKGLDLAEHDGAGPNVRSLLVRDLLRWTTTVNEGFTCPYAKAAFHVLNRLDKAYGIDNIPDHIDDIARDAGTLAKELGGLALLRMDGALSWEELERTYERDENELTGQNRYVLDDDLAERDPKAMLTYIAENAPERLPNPLYLPITLHSLQQALHTFQHNVTFNVFYMEGEEVQKATAVDAGTFDAYFMRDVEGQLYFMPMG